MLIETPYEHITLNSAGIPIITGTTMKVTELVAERLAWGWSPEEVHLNHPYLTLGQIYSALAYYADHQDEVEAAIEVDAQLMEDYRKKAKPSPLLNRLKNQGSS